MATPRPEKLRAYTGKRDFKQTPEPAGGGKESSPKPIFVIQKHDASSLHYDFRLEVDGVLKSWVIPKGPSTNPQVRRLAIATEDHPLEYADFEGVIPSGQYGGGTVMVWDTGAYENMAEQDGTPISMEESIRAGRVVVWLQGKKLRGGFALISLGGRWLLVKMHDEEADAGDIIRTQPNSALTGRSLEEIAAEWQQRAA